MSRRRCHPGVASSPAGSPNPVHMLLYLLLLVIPLLGIVTFIWHGRVFDFGLFKVDFGVHKNRAIFHPTENIHGWRAYTLFTVVGLHVLAALWHQLYRRDGLLLRMWPARRNRVSRGRRHHRAAASHGRRFHCQCSRGERTLP